MTAIRRRMPDSMRLEQVSEPAESQTGQLQRLQTSGRVGMAALNAKCRPLLVLDDKLWFELETVCDAASQTREETFSSRSLSGVGGFIERS